MSVDLIVTTSTGLGIAAALPVMLFLAGSFFLNPERARQAILKSFWVFFCTVGTTYLVRMYLVHGNLNLF
jgi:uncharacterized membrane protein